MEFSSDVPLKKSRFILVRNFHDEIWNFPVINYRAYFLEDFIGVWKIKQLKK